MITASMPKSDDQLKPCAAGSPSKFVIVTVWPSWVTEPLPRSAPSSLNSFQSWPLAYAPSTLLHVGLPARLGSWRDVTVVTGSAPKAELVTPGAKSATDVSMATTSHDSRRAIR